MGAPFGRLLTVSSAWRGVIFAHFWRTCTNDTPLQCRHSLAGWNFTLTFISSICNITSSTTPVYLHNFVYAGRIAADGLDLQNQVEKYVAG